MASGNEVELLLKLKDEMSSGFKRIDDQQKKTFNSLNKNSKKSEKSVDGLIKTIIAGGAAFVGWKVAGFTKDVIELGMEAERTKKTFSLLAGSQEKGNKLFNELNELANKTPLDNFDLYPIAQALQAFGTELKDVTPELQMLGNLALGNAVKMGRLADAFGKVQTKGRASLEELNRFAEAGVPVFDALADRLGVTKQEVFDLITKGKVGFDDLKGALKDLTSEGGQFHDIMAEVSETSAGKFSTSVGKSKLAMADFGERVLPAVNLAIYGFNAGLEASVGILDRIAETIGFKTTNEELNKSIISLQTLNKQTKELAKDRQGLQKLIDDDTFDNFYFTSAQVYREIEAYDARIEESIELAKKLKKEYKDLGGKQSLTIFDPDAMDNPVAKIASQDKPNQKIKKTSTIDNEMGDLFLNTEIDIAISEDQKESFKEDINELDAWEKEQDKKINDEKLKAHESFMEKLQGINKDYADREFEEQYGKLELLEQQKAEEIEIHKNSAEEIAAIELLYANKIAEEKEKLAQDDIKRQQTVANAYWDSLSMIMSAANKALANDKSNATARKAFAIAEININAARAMMGVWADPGYPAAIPLTIAIGAQSSIASGIVASQTFAGGGEVQPEYGKSNQGDKISIGVNAGEEIITSDDPRHSRNMGGNYGGNSAPINVTLELDGEVMAQVVADANSRNEFTGRGIGL